MKTWIGGIITCFNAFDLILLFSFRTKKVTLNTLIQHYTINTNVYMWLTNIINIIPQLALFTSRTPISHNSINSQLIKTSHTLDFSLLDILFHAEIHHIWNSDWTVMYTVYSIVKILAITVTYAPHFKELKTY